jgi:CheY-like chemotaxis protein
MLCVYTRLPKRFVRPSGFGGSQSLHAVALANPIEGVPNTGPLHRRPDRFASWRAVYSVPAPDLILLDLNMPVMDGREVLAELVEDDRLNHLPVVILTTSADAQDVLEMYKLRCSSYATKPVNLDQFLGIIQGISEYWFTVVVRPTPPL